MKELFFCIFLICTLSVVSLAQKDPNASSQLPSGWEMLFNGVDLEGWYLVTRDTTYKGSKEELFGVQNGTIHVYPTQEAFSTQTFAGLLTEKVYENFDLTMEYKWGEKKFKPRHEFVRDAGIIFHVHGKDIIWPNGVECQIQEGDTGDLWAIGTQVSSKVSPIIRNYAPNGQLETLGKPEQRFHRFHRGYFWEIPEWNQIELQVRGDHAVFKVNGNVVNEAIQMKYYQKETNSYLPLTQGKILIQAEGAELYYRNIWIREVKNAK